MVGVVVEKGCVMAAVSEEGDQDAPRNGEEDVVDVMVPIDHQGSCNETCSEEGENDRKPFPEAGVVIRESFQLRVQVKSQEHAHEERLRSVTTGK